MTANIIKKIYISTLERIYVTLRSVIIPEIRLKNDENSALM